MRRHQQHYIRPENAIEQAEKLLEVGGTLAAMEVLRDAFFMRSRNTSIALLEPLVTRLLTLSVECNKPSVARDCLYTFKNLAQAQHLAAVENVVNHFISAAEARLEAYKKPVTSPSSSSNDIANATAAADNEALGAIEDLENMESFESHFMTMVGALEKETEDTSVSKLGCPIAFMTSTQNIASVHSVQHSLRARADSFAGRLRTLWIAFQIVIDLLRLNPKLELIYHSVAVRAFEFCARYKRKIEFRRMCDTLRAHLAHLARIKASSNAATAINLSDPDVLSRFLDLRFIQLETAKKLELWYECFRIAENIQEMFSLASDSNSMLRISGTRSLNAPHQRPLLPLNHPNKATALAYSNILARYYERMASVFSMADDMLYEAASWNKFFAQISSVRALESSQQENTEQLQEVANNMILSALAAPLQPPVSELETISDATADALRLPRRSNARSERLCSMLGLEKSPDRASLLADARCTGSAFSLASPLVRDIYSALEQNFHPVLAAKSIKKLLQELAETPGLQRFANSIRRTAMCKILQQTSYHYSCIPFDSMQNHSNITADSRVSLVTLEQLIFDGNRRSLFDIRVDHANRKFDFQDAFSKCPGNPDPRLADADSCAFALTRISEVSNMITEQQKKRVFEYYQSVGELEHQMILKTQDLIEQRKEQFEKETVKEELPEGVASKEEALAKANEEREALRARVEAETKANRMRELERERKEIERKEARKNAKQYRDCTGFTVPDEDLEKCTIDDVDALFRRHMIEERKSLQQRVQEYAVSCDYFERALRDSEIPMLHQLRETEVKKERQAFIDARRKAVSCSKRQHAQDLLVKQRLAKVQEEAQKYRHMFVDMYKTEIDNEVMLQQRKLEESKQRRRASARELIRTRLEKMRQEEQQRIAMEREAEEKKAEAERREKLLQQRQVQDDEARRTATMSATSMYSPRSQPGFPGAAYGMSGYDMAGPITLTRGKRAAEMQQAGQYGSAAPAPAPFARGVNVPSATYASTSSSVITNLVRAPASSLSSQQQTDSSMQHGFGPRPKASDLQQQQQPQQPATLVRKKNIYGHDTDHKVGPSPSAASTHAAAETQAAPAVQASLSRSSMRPTAEPVVQQLVRSQQPQSQPQPQPQLHQQQQQQQQQQQPAKQLVRSNISSSSAPATKAAPVVGTVPAPDSSMQQQQPDPWRRGTLISNKISSQNSGPKPDTTKPNNTGFGRRLIGS